MNLKAISLLLAPASIAAPAIRAEIVNITTDHNSLVLDAKKDGGLDFLYYGTRLTDAEAAALRDAGIPALDAFPFYGTFPEHESAMAMTHADGNIWLHTGDIGYVDEEGIFYVLNRGAAYRYGGGELAVLPMENRLADAKIKGIKDEFFVIVPDDEHEGCFLPYLYVQLKDGYTLDDVRDKINACLPERYMRPVEIFTVPERPFFHFKTNRIGLSKEIIAKRNQQKEKAKRNSFADGCIA